MPPDKQEEWIIAMNEPLPGREKAEPSQVQADIEGQGFMDFMATHAANTGG